MGITGLISFVKDATESIHIEKLSGQKVAIDSYCWLHKGAFSCAEKLAIGDKTTQYVKYCMNFIDMLKFHHITPILVFDGRHLPAKANEEKTRRDERKKNKQTAVQLLKAGQSEKARRYIAASIDVTHAMALELIKSCRKIGIDCLVAPYEADAQLAYLNINNYVDCVITEDSDLILFGCKKVIFKLQKTGTGLLYDKDKLPAVMGLPLERFQFSYFRRMCILSGCDYLPSLPGIGLVKAKKFILKTRDFDLSKSLNDISKHLNMPKLTVTEDYVNSFFKAEATFLYQYVYDPKLRKVVRLTEPSEDCSLDLLEFSGQFIEDCEAFQHALGNIDPFTKKVMDTWNPDNEKLKPKSIWNYRCNNNIESSPNSLVSNAVPPAFQISKSVQKQTKIITDIEEKEEEDLLNQYRKDPVKDNFKRQRDGKSPEKQSEQEVKVRIFPVKNTCSMFNYVEKKNEKETTLIEVQTSPKSSPKRSPSPVSPVLNKRRCIRSKFLSQSCTSSSESLITSSFFKRVENVSLIYSQETKTSSLGENGEHESKNIDENLPSSSQNSEIENQCTVNIIKSPVKKFSPPVKLNPPVKQIIGPAKQQGLSKKQKSDKNGIPSSQKILSQFGFVKKSQFDIKN